MAAVTVFPDATAAAGFNSAWHVARWCGVTKELFENILRSVGAWVDADGAHHLQKVKIRDISLLDPVELMRSHYNFGVATGPPDATTGQVPTRAHLALDSQPTSPRPPLICWRVPP